jgi:hypothetical protein
MFTSLFLATAHAQLSLPGQVAAVSNPAKILTFICTVLFSYLFTAAIFISIFFVLIAAYRYLTSSGNADQVSLASKTLLYAAVGVAIAILARSVPVIVGTFVAGQINLDPCPAGQTTTTSTT